MYNAYSTLGSPQEGMAVLQMGPWFLVSKVDECEHITSLTSPSAVYIQYTIILSISNTIVDNIWYPSLGCQYQIWFHSYQKLPEMLEVLSVPQGSLVPSYWQV